MKAATMAGRTVLILRTNKPSLFALESSAKGNGTSLPRNASDPVLIDDGPTMAAVA
jgi:hypothetical protein